MEKELIKCDICQKLSSKSAEDQMAFGDWMFRGDIKVHYYCLLLSTHLPQKGKDCAGILGFLVKDIRIEIEKAALRTCIYCNEKHASIRCHTCKDYFHLDCGYKNGCLFQFVDDFRSYCDSCFPLDNFQKQTLKDRPLTWLCDICQGTMTVYKPYNWIHAKCCGVKRWVERSCLQKYALSAGYGLRCIWCKNPKFRDFVRKQGIFVPDRDANWEREKGAYRDLHRGHSRCNIEPCLCPKGSEYITTGKWRLLLCSLCGSFGAHFGCVNSKQKPIKNNEFKCSVCEEIERNNRKPLNIVIPENSEINLSVFMHKNMAEYSPTPSMESLNFSTPSSQASMVTILEREDTPNLLNQNLMNMDDNSNKSQDVDDESEKTQKNQEENKKNSDIIIIESESAEEILKNLKQTEKNKTQMGDSEVSGSKDLNSSIKNQGISLEAGSKKNKLFDQAVVVEKIQSDNQHSNYFDNQNSLNANIDVEMVDSQSLTGHKTSNSQLLTQMIDVEGTPSQPDPSFISISRKAAHKQSHRGQLSTQIIDVEGTQSQNAMFDNKELLTQLVDNESSQTQKEIVSQTPRHHKNKPSSPNINIESTQKEFSLQSSDQISSNQKLVIIPDFTLILVKNSEENHPFTQIVDVESTQSQAEVPREISASKEPHKNLSPTQMVDIEMSNSSSQNLSEKDDERKFTIPETQEIDVEIADTQNLTDQPTLTPPEQQNDQKTSETLPHHSKNSTNNIEILDVGNRFHEFELLKLVNNDCVGTLVFRVDRLDPRFAGKSIQEIETSDLLDCEKDVIRTTNDRGIFDFIDQVIEEGNYK